MWAFLTIVTLGLLVASSNGEGSEKDLVRGLPGISFPYKPKMYAGYLNGSDANIFYWLLESQNNPNTKDPIIVWLGSYPGCSSLAGLLTEIGPFRPNLDGNSLWENVFSWTKIGHLLFIDAPANVGWSYPVNSQGKQPVVNDDQMTNYYFQAIHDFLNKYPQHANGDLYLAGEAYNGIIVPLLAKKIGEAESAKTGVTFPKVLKGIIIGNGVFSEKYQLISMVHLIYFRGLIGTDNWDDLLKKCNCDDEPSEDCNFFSSLTNPSSPCGPAVINVINSVFQNTTVDATNVYRDCYGSSTPKPKMQYSNPTEYLESISYSYFPPTSGKSIDRDAAAKSAPAAARDPARQINYDSTDALLGFPCWGDPGKYLAKKDVMKALHVAAQLQNKTSFTMCIDISSNYNRTYLDMSETMQYIMKNMTIRVLLYSGDADLEYNFLGQEWWLDRHFVKQYFPMPVKEQREQWTYRGQTAGFVKRYDRVDEVVIKGAGRYVPMDRGGPALQMMTNFIKSQSQLTPYSTPTNFNISPSSASMLTPGKFTNLLITVTIFFIGYMVTSP